MPELRRSFASVGPHLAYHHSTYRLQGTAQQATEAPTFRESLHEFFSFEIIAGNGASFSALRTR
jgi:hypothetical protein